ncbi:MULTISPECIES: terpene synthase family protein [unclassified Micromonospora]|uniref:terpene synthase family protein n=1 Tax=unclassified Micromonospora TaxID=2617518 RepID=UPI0022B62CF8|nr:MULTISPECIES: terpene synthase family protein [unclassified Micromonospora]MCZ7421990.1 terpene synthase family protein [Verrucosispora sp. WMMA2121]WBB93278.1 terpene synthase family protein [Verrucosispora sp. WMMC514]
MTPSPHVPVATGDALTVEEQARVCALAVTLDRDLHEVVTRHQDLFAARPFDAALISGIAMSVAFTAPEYPGDQLRLTARTVLWVFAADWQFDHLAQTDDDVQALVASCVTAANGDPCVDGGHPLALLLAEIRNELVSAPAFAAMGPMWRDEIGRMVAAMAQEWRWKIACQAPPASRRTALTLDEYLANADNAAVVLVSVTHWAHLGDQDCLDHVDDLLAASREVQRAIRLINDLGTSKRDLQWGDLNALMLVSRTEVTARLNAIIQSCHELIEPLEKTCPRQAAFLRRQISFTAGFYQVSDFWGSL